VSLLASGTYVLNDLFDLQEDRQHWSKRNRPIASGALPISRAVRLFFILMLAALALAVLSGPAVLLLLGIYAVLTISYSLSLKRQPITDTFVLAALFTLRLGIGIAAVGAEVSPWLLVFSMFLFASLSLAKRYTELTRMGEHDRSEAIGRGYVADDASLVLALGMASGLGAIVIMVLYLINDAFSEAFYLEPLWLWSFPAVLFLWISRIWLISHRGQLHDDPVAFAMRDRGSLIMGGFMALGFIAAVTGLHI
jgi:4-hydroxybenzoate polyprenyltransferase